MSCSAVILPGLKFEGGLAVTQDKLLVATLVACRHNDAVSSPAQDTVAAVTQDKLLVTTLAGDIMTQFQVLLRTQLQ